MADGLKHKLYAAESWVTGSQKWTSVRDAAAFIRWCERHREFVARHPDHEPVTILRIKDPGHPRAFYKHANHGIYLPYWAQDALVCVHELAHSTRPAGPAHGAEFVRVFHELVRVLMSEQQAAQLRLGLLENGIKALSYDATGKRLGLL